VLCKSASFVFSQYSATEKRMLCSSGSQIGGKLPPGEICDSCGVTQNQTTLLFCIMSDHCKRNFDMKCEKFLLVGNKT